MGNIDLLTCPHCGKKLNIEGKSLKCPANHTFDIAKEGYVNLLAASGKTGKVFGDSKDMIEARKRFLYGGYYSELLETLADIIEKEIKVRNSDTAVLDAGSGVGYYSDGLQKRIGNKALFYGVDLSKDGVKIASKTNNMVNYFISSIFDIPVKKQSFDIILNIFAPFPDNEFKRIIKEDGIVIYISPGAKHLWGLKEALYAAPYPNEEEKLKPEHFDIIDVKRVNYEITVNGGQEVEDLIKMTPYYWNTSLTKINEVVAGGGNIVTAIEFIITILKKRGLTQ